MHLLVCQSGARVSLPGCILVRAAIAKRAFPHFRISECVCCCSKTHFSFWSVILSLFRARRMVDFFLKAVTTFATRNAKSDRRTFKNAVNNSYRWPPTLATASSSTSSITKSRKELLISLWGDHPRHHQPDTLTGMVTCQMSSDGLVHQRCPGQLDVRNGQSFWP